MVDEKVVNDLLQFLTLDARTDCKDQAVEHIAGLSGDPEGVAFLKEKDKLIDSLVLLTKDASDSVSKNAYKALINIATDKQVCQKLLNVPNFLTELIRYVLQADSEYADGVCMLLINLSHHEECAKQIVDTITENMETIGFDKIIQVFCSVNFNPKNTMHDLGPFLQNLTQITEARQFIMDKERCVIQRLLPFTEYKESVTRRKSIIAVLKNCCFETDYHDWLLGETIDILPRLLLPLAGPEELDEDDMEKLPDELQYLDSDKTRESDPEIRKMLVESVIKLCSRQSGRGVVKSKNTYIIMREYHRWETDEDIIDTIQECINLLIMDEPEEGLEDLDKVEIPTDIKEKFERMDSEGIKRKNIKNADGSQWVT